MCGQSLLHIRRCCRNFQVIKGWRRQKIYASAAAALMRYSAESLHYTIPLRPHCNSCCKLLSRAGTLSAGRPKWSITTRIRCLSKVVIMVSGLLLRQCSCTCLLRVLILASRFCYEADWRSGSVPSITFRRVPTMPALLFACRSGWEVVE